MPKAVKISTARLDRKRGLQFVLGIKSFRFNYSALNPSKIIDIRIKSTYRMLSGDRRVITNSGREAMWVVLGAADKLPCSILMRPVPAADLIRLSRKFFPTHEFASVAFRFSVLSMI